VTSHVEQQIAARIAAVKAKKAKRRKQREELQRARQYGLQARHNTKVMRWRKGGS
jgi:hypothetical protein